MSVKGPGGHPTGPEVQMLINKFGQPAEGTKISYEQISQIIHHPKGSLRYNTVTGAWRNEMFRSYNIKIGCERDRKSTRLNSSHYS